VDRVGRLANLARWDEAAPLHAQSALYDLESFRAGRDDIRPFEHDELGSVEGRDLLHLQCHIGTDTLSWARHGARVSGLDFSPNAIDIARTLAAECAIDAKFWCADVYDALEAVGGRTFDVVYTGIGALCWLPDVKRWARVVAGLARPGGRLFIREAHPVLWALDESRSDELVLGYPYFEHSDPFVEDAAGTYVTSDVEFTHNVTHTWNHGLGEIITALFDAGMQVTGFVEHQSVPWEALPGQMEKIALDEWQLIDRPWRLAHSYTLQATKVS
jgi:SAM-dependent methyltransferase